MQGDTTRLQQKEYAIMHSGFSSDSDISPIIVKVLVYNRKDVKSYTQILIQVSSPYIVMLHEYNKKNLQWLTQILTQLQILALLVWHYSVRTKKAQL